MKNEIQDSVEYLRKNDTVIRGIIDIIGPCTLKPSKDYYNSLVKSIIHQQLSNKAAGTIYSRFLNQLNNKLSPKNLLDLTDEEFKKAGVSKQKKAYLRDLSEKFYNGNIDLSKLSVLEDEEVINQLTSVRGIGKWSAEMFLIFCLNRLNVLPLDDVGFRNSIKHNYKLKQKPSKEEVLEISKKWVPYRSIAVWYLWQSLNKNA